ncbi:Bacterial extracellular solute-binding protein, family 7 [Synechococcus sp. PCC 7335]|uniref:TRAP transporter substrate-binding protein n=1 Tax=Synechococcus sp. (strain ATCC 29403 / PCC 7335) TaxID=91464 RepID=UPI00017ECB73|nr:TRAP transporter substrate-binding protein DctP [Synechococcus sp. PCC 7335]EDX83473.1 Bacterial extracellular solute-binding protein, family 7 [Synechococcus sp. PCC 7335]
MRRRKLIKKAALGAVGSATAGSVVQTQTANQTADRTANQTADQTTSPNSTAKIAATQPAIEWRMATSWPEGQGITFRSAVDFCDRVAAMTDGQFIITPYASGAIAPALEVFEAVRSGEVECGHTSSLYYIDKNPALVFGTTVPFGLTPYQQYAWFYYGGGEAAMTKLHDPFDVVVFPAGSAGIQMGSWTNKEVETVADLAGLKMRITGFGAKVMQRLGVETVALAGDQIYAALEAGTVDAAEWQSPQTDEQLKLYEVAQYCYYPGWWEPGSTYKLVINQAQWQQLPKAYQSILRSAAAAANLTTLADFDAASGEALQRLVDRGVKLKPYSIEIMEAAQRTTFELLEESARTDPTFKALYDQWRQFRRQIFQWNQINELSFEQFSLQSQSASL